MKKTRKTAIIAVVLVMAIALAGFGYAAWSASISVTGGATVQGTFDVDMQVILKATSAEGVTAPIPSSTSTGVEEVKDPADPSKTIGVKVDTENLLNVSLGQIQFTMPGAWAQYEVTITNNSTIDIAVDNAQISTATVAPGGTQAATMIQVDKTMVDAAIVNGHTIVKAGGSCVFEFVVYVVDADTADAELDETISNALTFSADFLAVMNNADVPTPIHTDNAAPATPVGP